ncbi:hypothetical protein ACKKBF_B30745 [Auxenochlorella protothecoides x Auxenochlorella symbiontica]
MLRRGSANPTAVCLAMVLLCLRPATGAVVGQAAPVSEEGEVLQFCNTTAPPLLASTSSKQDLIGPLLHVAISTSIVGYHSFGWADSGRPTLLLIHGFGQSLDMWDVRLLEPLAREQRVIIFDTRGVGATEDLNISSPLTIQSMAEDTVEFIQALRLPLPPNLMGVSMGGFIAIAVAALHGDAIHRAIPISASAGSLGSEPPTDKGLSIVAQPERRPLDMLSLFYPLNTTRGAKAACDFAFQSLYMLAEATITEAYGRQALAILHYFNVETAVWDALPLVRNPVLLIAGQYDILVPVQSSRAMAARLPAPWLVVIPEAGHGVASQCRDTVLDLVDAFLGSPDL